MADSPAADLDPQALPDSSAGTQNTGSSGPGPVPYERFQEMVHARQFAERQAHQYEQRLAQLEAAQQRMQQRDPTQPLSAEEQQAAHAIKQLLQRDPELRQLWMMRQAAPHLLNGFQQTQQLQHLHQQNYLRSGRQEIERMAGEANRPVSPDAVNYYEELVAGVIRRTPGAQARFQAGDMSVVPEAWQKVNAFLGQFGGPAAAQIAQVKQQTRALPPALHRTPGGGATGQPAQPKFDLTSPEGVRQKEDWLHSNAFSRLRELSGTP